MANRETEILDEALEYLNEGKIRDKVKKFLDKLKKKNKRNQETATKTQPKKIAECVTNEKRKEFVKKILAETKSVLPIFNDGISGANMSPFGVEFLDDNEDFWEGVVYEGEEEEYEKNPNANKFYSDYISLIGGDDYYIKGVEDMENPSDVYRMPIYKKRNDNFAKGMNELKRKLSKYGTIDSDGDKWESYIFLYVKDGIIE